MGRRKTLGCFKCWVFIAVVLIQVEDSIQVDFLSVALGQPCTRNSQCASGHCEVNLCDPRVDCLTTPATDCTMAVAGYAGTATTICDVGNTNFCVECLTDAHCQANQRCTQTVCVDCVNDGDCATGVCDPACQVCRQCVQNTDCPTNAPVCMANRCVCMSDADCATGVCQNEFCIACTNDDHCANGVCVNRVCVECRDDGNCEKGTCLNNACKPTKVGLGVLGPLWSGLLLTGVLIFLAVTVFGVPAGTQRLDKDLDFSNNAFGNENILHQIQESQLRYL